MSAYAVAWSVVAASGCAIAYLVFRVTRRWLHTRYLACALVLALALTPFRFDDEHLAPASAVAAFRFLFEPESDRAGPLAALAGTAVGLFGAYVVLFGVRAVVVRKRGKQAGETTVE